VRSETVISGTGALVEQLCDEGANVASRQTVAMLYNNQDALSCNQQITVLEKQKTQLEYALSAGGSTQNAASMDQSILNAVTKIHTDVSQGDLSNLDDNSLSLKGLVLKHSYLYGENGESLTDIQTQINSCAAQISQLTTQSSSDTKSVAAPCSGLYSGVVDGFESLITPDQLDGLSVDTLQSLLSQAPSPNGSTLGKIITGMKWYFAAVMDENTAARLGSTAKLVFSRSDSGEISMNVDRIGTAENGQCVVVFSSDTDMAKTTLLRKQTVDLVFSEYSGIRIPADAMRVNSSGQTGVYVVSGAQAKFKPVNRIYSGDGFYLVSPTADSTSDTYLRAGEEIILAASDLYDGKIVR
jgi:putative membrane fusion protein